MQVLAVEGGVFSSLRGRHGLSQRGPNTYSQGACTWDILFCLRYHSGHPERTWIVTACVWLRTLCVWLRTLSVWVRMLSVWLRMLSVQILCG